MSEKIEKKGKKKFKAKYVVIAIVALLVVGIVGSMVVGAATPTSIPCVAVSTGDIEKVVDVSGNIESDETRTIFAVSDTQVGEISVKAGDSVSNGDELFSYDEESLKLAINKASLSNQVAQGNYEDSVETDDKNTETVILSEMSLPIVEQQIIDQQIKVDELKDKIKKKQRTFSNQKRELEKQIAEPDINDTRKEIATKEMADAEYKINNDTEIVQWQEELSKAEDLLKQYKADKEEIKADKKATEKSLLTEGAKKSNAAKKNLESLTNNDIINTLSAAKGGVKSEFNGIVTEVKVVDGATVTKGTEIMTLASTDSMHVRVNLTKNDTKTVSVGQKVDIAFNGQTYEGTVSRIDKVAKKNESGAIVVGCDIEIANPDTNLILQAEAKVKIHVDEVKGVTVLSNDMINFGDAGSFVYVIKDGTVVNQPVTLGLTNDTFSEIKEGLSVGDTVVKSEAADMIFEGMEATAVVEE